VLACAPSPKPVAASAAPPQLDAALLESAVRDHAAFLGFDDPAFLWLAREALLAPLPPGWQSVAAAAAGDTDSGGGGGPDLYYVNTATGAASWDHPLDGEYRARYAVCTSTAIILGGRKCHTCSLCRRDHHLTSFNCQRKWLFAEHMASCLHRLDCDRMMCSWVCHDIYRFDRTILQ
jgi:hypothetical protein